MEIKGNERQIVTDALGEDNLKVLPIYYRWMEPVLSAGNPPATVKSRFHNTTAYNSVPFYKPISKILIQAGNESE